MKLDPASFTGIHPQWAELSAEHQETLIEQARHATFNESQKLNLIFPFYILVCIPFIALALIGIPFWFFENQPVAILGMIGTILVGIHGYANIQNRLISPRLKELIEQERCNADDE